MPVVLPTKEIWCGASLEGREARSRRPRLRALLMAMLVWLLMLWLWLFLLVRDVAMGSEARRSVVCGCGSTRMRSTRRGVGTQGSVHADWRTRRSAGEFHGALSPTGAYSRRKCAVRCRWGVTRAGAWRVENAQQIEVGKTEKKGRESTTERGCQ